MTQERLATQEGQSVWRSRLFKFGLVVAVVGAVLSTWKVATAGVLFAGIGWAAWKGKK